MGPIQDHAREHLVPTDKAIVMTRRSLARRRATWSRASSRRHWTRSRSA